LFGGASFRAAQDIATQPRRTDEPRHALIIPRRRADQGLHNNPSHCRFPAHGTPTRAAARWVFQSARLPIYRRPGKKKKLRRECHRPHPKPNSAIRNPLGNLCLGPAPLSRTTTLLTGSPRFALHLGLAHVSTTHSPSNRPTIQPIDLHSWGNIPTINSPTATPSPTTTTTTRHPLIPLIPTTPYTAPA